MDRWPDFYRVRSDLSTIGPVVLVGDRVSIPSSLQSKVLEVLHSAHQQWTVGDPRGSFRTMGEPTVPYKTIVD